VVAAAPAVVMAVVVKVAAAADTAEVVTEVR
jgi:hypothetical protein